MTGAPSPDVVTLPFPDRLFIPLESRRLDFGELRVEDGQSVTWGQVLAVDAAHYSLPLLAPYAGTVRLDEADGHIVLDGLQAPRATASASADALTASARPLPQTAAALVDLGVWQFFSDARTGAPVDPAATPDTLIVPVLSLEPFLAGGEALLAGRIDDFESGLDHLQSLFQTAALVAIIPDVDDTLASEVEHSAESASLAHVVTVPLRYPFDDPILAGRLAGLCDRPDARLWSLSLEGLLALDAAVTHGRPCTERTISLAGPAVAEPVHLRAIPGYPIDAILNGRLTREPARVIEGGLLTGRTLPEGRLGLDADCAGLTVLGELTKRTFMAFARPGVSRRSYNRSFVGTFRPEMGVRYRTGLSGELRFRLDDPAEISQRPGQYVQLQAPSPEGPVYRAYSISSPAHDTGAVELVVRLVPGGVGSTYCHNLEEGDPVVFTGPYGEFRLNEDPEVDVILIGGGSGMAPLRNLLMSVLERWPERKCQLFFGCRTTQDVFYYDEFRSITEKHPNFEIHYALSDPIEEGETWDGESGFIHLSAENHLDESDRRRQAFLCGPPPMIEAVMKVLEAKGLESDDIFYDEF